MYITIPENSIRPYNIILITHLVAISAWFIPDFGFLIKGFTNPIDFYSISGAGLIAYLLLLYVVSFLGYHLALKKGVGGTGSINTSLINSNRLYVFFILTTLIGLMVTVIKIFFSIGFDGILYAIATGTVNEFKELIYEDYQPGFTTLRYGAIFCGSLLIYRRLEKIKNLKLDLIAFIILFSSTLISSRLTLVASIVGGLYLLIIVNKGLRLSVVRLVYYFFITFGLLSLFNWSRNFGYYDSSGLSFWSAGFSEVIAYLGAPIQGALFAITQYDNQYNLNNYWELSTIFVNLNTNSALLGMLANFNILGVVYIFITVFFASFFISFCERYKKGFYVFVIIPLIYSFSDFWRLFLFNQGIILFLMLLGLSVFFVVSLRQSLKKGVVR